MKIICVGMNYAKHNEELKHTLSQINGIELAHPMSKDLCGEIMPTLFLKPETALTRPDWPFFVPDWSNQVEYETEVVVKICKLGKSIPERFAHRYYEDITLGIDFTARDIQKQLSQKGLPWEIAKGFDGAAYCGQKWLKIKDLGKPIQDLNFEMKLNGETRQVGWTGDMIHSIDRIISYASQFYLLKTGDIIFTGTPSGVGKVKEGDVITASLEGHEVLTCRCK